MFVTRSMRNPRDSRMKTIHHRYSTHAINGTAPSGRRKGRRNGSRR